MFLMFLYDMLTYSFAAALDADLISRGERLDCQGKWGQMGHQSAPGPDRNRARRSGVAWTSSVLQRPGLWGTPGGHDQ